MSDAENTPYTMREGALAMHELYTSYLEAGFTEEQALDLIKALITPRS